MKKNVTVLASELIGIYHQIRNQPVNCGPVDLSGITEEDFKPKFKEYPKQVKQEPIQQDQYDEPKSKYINKPQRNFRKR